ncbi:MAG: hypothetical protein R2772_04695 [Chitinophagales bacterium]
MKFLLSFALIFCGIQLSWASNEAIFSKYKTYYADSDTSDGYSQKKKIKLEDRMYTTVVSGLNLSFLVGSDAKSVKNALKNNLDQAGIHPRYGYFIKFYTSFLIKKGFAVLVGGGYEQRGWWERHDVAFQQSFYPGDIVSNDVYTRMDYLTIYLGASYQFNSWFALRTGMDLGILAYSYARTGRFRNFFNMEYYGVPRKLTRSFVPNYDFALVFGKVGGVSMDVGMQYTGKVLKEYDYNFLMFKIGLNIGFNYIVPQQNAMM